MTYSLAIVVPCYNHAKTLRSLFAELRDLNVSVFLVDDASDESNRELIALCVKEFSFVKLIRRSENGGKGAAVMDGLKAAYDEGFTHALQIDADGQHDVGDAKAMIELSKNCPKFLISGYPIYDETVPKGRLIGRYITHFWVWLETLSSTIVDSMCGFRVYPLETTVGLLKEKKIGTRMDFDIEILVRLYWKGVPMKFVPTRVRYPEGGVSHFHVLRDNIRISKMHAALFMESLGKWPELFRRNRMEHWSKVEERRGLLGMQLLIAIYRVFGRRVFDLALYPVLCCFWIFAKKQRQCSEIYLKRIREFAHSRNRMISEKLTSFRHFRHFAVSVLDKIVGWMGDIKYGEDAVCEDETTKRVLSQTRGQTGKLLFVSHLGTVEVCRAIAENDQAVTINALVFDDHAPRFKRVMEKLAPNARVHLIAVNHIGIETAVELKEKLSRGEWVAIAADRTPIRNDGSGVVAVTFLGQKAWFPIGPYILASILQAPVCALFANRSGNKINIFARDFAQRVKVSRHNRDEDVYKWAEQYVRMLEDRTLDYPLEWFNFYDFWAGAETKNDGEKIKNSN